MLISFSDCEVLPLPPNRSVSKEFVKSHLRRYHPLHHELAVFLTTIGRVLKPPPSRSTAHFVFFYRMQDLFKAMFILFIASIPSRIMILNALITPNAISKCTGRRTHPATCYLFPFLPMTALSSSSSKPPSPTSKTSCSRASSSSVNSSL